MKGSYGKETKFTAEEAVIRELLGKKVSQSAIGRILDVNRGTLARFVKRYHPEGPDRISSPTTP